jgi:hypothetical protein
MVDISVDSKLDSLEETDPVILYISQIRMVLMNESDIMGATDMSNSLEEMVYDLQFSNKRIKQVVVDLIYKYCTLASDFPTVVNVKRLTGELRDIVIVDININNNKTINFAIK